MIEGERNRKKGKLKNGRVRDFPGGPVVETLHSNAGGVGSIPGGETKIPHASRPKNQNIKQKQYGNKFNKDFKNGPHQKKIFLIKINFKKRTGQLYTSLKFFKMVQERKNNHRIAHSSCVNNSHIVLKS